MIVYRIKKTEEEKKKKKAFGTHKLKPKKSKKTKSKSHSQQARLTRIEIWKFQFIFFHIQEKNHQKYVKICEKEKKNDFGVRSDPRRPKIVRATCAQST